MINLTRTAFRSSSLAPPILDEWHCTDSHSPGVAWLDNWLDCRIGTALFSFLSTAIQHIWFTGLR